MYNKITIDAINEIKQTLKPSFHCPYLTLNLQNCTSIKGLYDTGADISCVSEKYFRQIPLNHRPVKLKEGTPHRFKTAGGQPLNIRGRYKFNIKIGTKTLTHDFYVIPDLNEPLILGIDFIQKHQLWYCPKNESFAWEGQPNWGQGQIKVASAMTIPPLSVAFIRATVRTEGGALPEGTTCIANVPSSSHPLVTGGLYLVQPDNLGQVTIAVQNCSPMDLELDRNDFIGQVENVHDSETQELNPVYLQAVACQQHEAKPRQKHTEQTKKFILESAKLQVPESLH